MCDSIRDALIQLKQSGNKTAETLLVDVEQSKKIKALKNYRTLKVLVQDYFHGQNTPRNMAYRPDVVRNAETAISRISRQGDWAVDQAVSRIKNAWKNESCFKLALDTLR